MLALGPLRADQSSPVTENAGDDARAITYGARGSKAGRRGHSRPPTTGVCNRHSRRSGHAQAEIVHRQFCR